MFRTILGTCLCGGSASLGCAHAVPAMLAAETPQLRKRIAAVYFALFPAVTAVSCTPSFACYGSLAIGKRAEPSSTVLRTEPASENSCIAPSG